MRRSALFLIALLVLLGGGFGLWWWQQQHNFRSEERTGTLRVQPQAIAFTAKPADFVTLVFVVHNESVAQRELSLQAEAPSGWSLLELPTEITLDAGRSQEIFVTAQIPPGASPERYLISLRAQDASDAAVGRTQVRIPPWERLKIAVPPEQPMLRPGEERAISVTVTNRGNVRLSTTLRVTGAPPGWRFSLSLSSFALDPGRSQSVELRLKAPERASPALAIFTIEALGGRAVDRATITVVLAAP